MTRRAAAALLVVLVATACRAPETFSRASSAAPVPRKTVIWLDTTGLDQATATQLQRVGVDQLVVPLGTVNLAGGSPVLRLEPIAPVAGPIPVAVSLQVNGVGGDLDPGAASQVWRAISAEMGETTPAEIILDLPEVVPRVSEFLARLSDQAGVPVVPILTLEQLRSEAAVKAATVARLCVVPMYGSGHPSVRGVGELATLSLDERLAPLASTGVRVRPAVSLRPLTVPETEGWGDDLRALTEPANATVSTSSVLDRTFVLSQPMEWSGRQWRPGESVAVRWFDASRLDSALREMNRLILPELGGWDLIPLPPEGNRLGMGREALIRYLGGEGPRPDLRVSADNERNRLIVSLTNPSPYASAVSSGGNWVEVSVESGSLIAEGVGSFDRLVLGSMEEGEWKPKFLGAPTAVRFYETYLGSGEELQAGSIRLSPGDVNYRVVWNFVLSSGEVITGELEK
jgi:hypothetical protein